MSLRPFTRLRGNLQQDPTKLAMQKRPVCLRSQKIWWGSSSREWLQHGFLNAGCLKIDFSHHEPWYSMFEAAETGLLKIEKLPQLRPQWKGRPSSTRWSERQAHKVHLRHLAQGSTLTSSAKESGFFFCAKTSHRGSLMSPPNTVGKISVHWTSF